MNRILWWLNPKTGLRGLAFGYLFGLAGWAVMVVEIVHRDGLSADALLRNLKMIPVGLLWAIPWALLWGMSGAFRNNVPYYPANVITALGIAAGTAYSLTTGTWGGWQIITIPVQSHVATILFHLPGFGILAVIKLNQDDE